MIDSRDAADYSDGPPPDRGRWSWKVIALVVGYVCIFVFLTLVVVSHSLFGPPPRIRW
jgi:hypothetical protein